MTFTTTEQLLLRGAGPAISPVTLPTINGSVLRGVLAQRCADADQLARVIISGDVVAAPGFLMVKAGRYRPGYPAPRTLARVELWGSEQAIDVREQSEAGISESVRGLIAFDGAQWTPVLPRVHTHTRLARPRRGGSMTGLGPISFTVLEPGQVFRAWFRLTGDYEALRADLVALLDSEARGGQLVSFGSGAAGSYGGEAHVVVGALTDLGDDWLPRDTIAGEYVDLVLRSPALVVASATGQFDPAALGEHVRGWLARHQIAATVAEASVTRVPVGGAHAGYGRMRPTHWAAGAGSVVTVITSADITESDWASALRDRIGTRAVDGLGMVAMVPDLAEETWLASAQTSHPLPVAEPVADDEACAQLALLQEELFTAAAREWAIVTADAIVAASLDSAGFGVSLLGRLRGALDTAETLRTVLRGFADASSERFDSPVMATLTKVRVGPMSLHAWLLAATGDDIEGAWAAIGPGPSTRVNYTDDCVARLTMICLDTDTDATVARWIDTRCPILVFDLVKAIVLAFARATQRGVPQP
ncbi:hypothetical protein ACGFIX_14425 [Nocardia salmonicida]|uniref:hypothetical protein n=1 Tax=Nocardia salmonicida TaxID=53431 RepID=UPI00370FB92A